MHGTSLVGRVALVLGGPCLACGRLGFESVSDAPYSQTTGGCGPLDPRCVTTGRAMGGVSGHERTEASPSFGQAGTSGLAPSGGQAGEFTGTAPGAGATLAAGASGSGGSCEPPSPACAIVRAQTRRLTSDQPNGPSILLRLNLVSNALEPIALSELLVRYWYTAESTALDELSCESGVIGCDALRSLVVELVPGRPGADRVVELGFLPSAGTLAPAGETGEVALRLRKPDSANYDETNDYSYLAGSGTFTDNERVTIYRNGKLVWGAEP